MDLPENGLITIAGSNSNGKSSLVGFLIDVFKCNFKTNAKCRKYISYWANEGAAYIEGHCGTKIHVSLKREAVDSTYSITMPDKKPIIMSVKDPSLEHITKAIFKIDPGKDSINFFSLHKSKLLGVSTTPQETFRIFEKYVTDNYVKESVENLSEFVKKNKEALRYIEIQIKSREEVVEKTYGNINKMKDILNKIVPARDVEAMMKQFKLVEPFNLNVEYGLSQEDEELLLLAQKEIVPPTRVNTVNIVIPKSIYQGAMITMPDMVNIVNFKAINMPRVDIPTTPSILQQDLFLFDEYKEATFNLEQLMNKTCPTCGKPLHNEHSHAN